MQCRKTARGWDLAVRERLGKVAPAKPALERGQSWLMRRTVRATSDTPVTCI